MNNRKKLALVFRYEENWIGGTYYILNIIRALNTLDQSEKPEITIISTKKEDFTYVQSETDYPFLGFIKIRKKRRIDSLAKIYPKLKYVIKPQVIDPDFDMVFPNPEKHYVIKNENSKCFWIPDFQEAHLTEFFSDQEIVNRKQSQVEIAVTARKLILSSNNALKDFNTLYPFSKTTPLVLPFAVSNNKYSIFDLKVLRKKFDVKPDFFFCANQFMIHKNHITVLEAVKKLRSEGIDTQVLFSGKEFDYRQPGLVEMLRNFVHQNDLSEHVKFLGFIDRDEMLSLMYHSSAVVQPSLFEGWSTVIEDAKSLGKYVIASDIDIHQEQLQHNFALFKAGDPNSLAEAITTFLQSPPELEETDYNANIKTFAKKFYEYI